MPHWNETIHLGDVFHNDDLTFEQKRDVIVQRIRASRWFRNAGEDSFLAQLVDELGSAESANEFDAPWSLIYDAADIDRTWIETVR